ncbi:hypothetical protein GWI33_019958 [Rhynchophorus ferrugineus]|uniref:Apoptosis regulatory protein Siva n=1 Tax=Rhynchophorus ferrugineus TaxID=354439 RepID=A0A834HTB8_RHYFE|nr:hypothetical protein GWI33_019958 [Rhynchophorus ferrugineus]
MPKRLCPFTDDEQAIKKQETLHGNKGRQIKSLSAERALQLLFQGASKQFSSKENIGELNESLPNAACTQCHKSISSEIKCFYCDKIICIGCSQLCTKCDEYYCKNCAFLIDEEKSHAICYSCY